MANYYYCFSFRSQLVFNVKLFASTLEILIPPKGLLNKLKREAENPKEVMDQVWAPLECFLQTSCPFPVLISSPPASPPGQIPCWVGKVPGAGEKEGGRGKRERASSIRSDRLAWLCGGRDSRLPAQWARWYNRFHLNLHLCIHIN